MRIVITQRHIDYFWQRVNKLGPDDCWNWTGALKHFSNGSYGYFSRPIIYAHRLSWLLAHKESPKGDVLHKCDNPTCVNPNHLFIGTQSDNNKDMASKGRHFVGADSNRTPFSDSDIIMIRQWVKDGVRICDIARHFNVTWRAIYAIKRGERWKHIPL